MPDGGMLALVGFGAVRGVSACASAPYCGFCASAFFCCCNDSDVACCKLREFIRVARSLHVCQHTDALVWYMEASLPLNRRSLRLSLVGKATGIVTEAVDNLGQVVVELPPNVRVRDDLLVLEVGVL
jgi:hypothetical protein